MPCGLAPLPRSLGKTTRHRLNRGGDRFANSAPHMIAVVRWHLDPVTKAYVAGKIGEVHSNPEIFTCLKRSIARRVYCPLRNQQRQAGQTLIAA